MISAFFTAKRLKRKKYFNIFSFSLFSSEGTSSVCTRPTVLTSPGSAFWIFLFSNDYFNAIARVITARNFFLTSFFLSGTLRFWKKFLFRNFHSTSRETHTFHSFLREIFLFFFHLLENPLDRGLRNVKKIFFDFASDNFFYFTSENYFMRLSWRN